jgi:hypothetical protein
MPKKPDKTSILFSQLALHDEVLFPLPDDSFPNQQFASTCMRDFGTDVMHEFWFRDGEF